MAGFRSRLAAVAGALLWAGPAEAVTMTQAPQASVAGRNTTVWWKTDVSSTTELGYGPSPSASFAAYPVHSGTASPAGTVHSRTVRRLPPGTYYYRARSNDGTGAVESAERTFVVPRSEAFPLGDLSFNGEVRAVARLASTWYVGGFFTSVGVTSGGGVATDATSGTLLDGDFPEVAGTVRAVVPDGVGGF